MPSNDAMPQSGADWTIPQGWDRFTADEHAMWDQLFARQSTMLPGRVSQAFRSGACLCK